MITIDDLLARNRAFAAQVDLRQLAMPEPSTMAGRLLLIVICADPRVEPAGVLGLQVGDAGILRNTGGRADDRVVDDLVFLSMRLHVRLDVSVVHHTQCGTGLLADPVFRTAYAGRTGLADDVLARRAVADPLATVRHDTRALLTHPLLTSDVLASVSGHVLRLETGLIETVVGPTAVIDDLPEQQPG